MLNEQTRKEFGLRLDEIESGLDSGDTPLRVMAVVGFAALLQELEPAIAAGEFALESNYDFGQRVLSFHDRLAKS